MRKILLLFIFMCLFFFCAVNQDYKLLNNMIKTNNCEGAVKKLEKDKSLYGSNAKLLYYLDNGAVNTYCGRFQDSNKFLFEAKDIADALWTKSVSKNLASYISNDMSIPYPGEDFERVMINLFAAINYLNLDKKEEALVECRQMDNLLSIYNSKYADKKNAYKEDAFARYLSGIIYESDKDFDNAFIDYKKAYFSFLDYSKNYNTKIPQILKEDLLQTAKRVHRYNEVKSFMRDHSSIKTMDTKNKGKLVLIFFNGDAPIKISKSHKAKTKSGTVSIAFPKYVVNPPKCQNNKVIIKSKTNQDLDMPLYLVEDINKIAVTNLSDKKVRIWAKAVARAVTKQIGIDAISGAATNNDNAKMLAKIGLNLLNNVALEKADTRSWRTLPGEISLGRVFLKEGVYNIEVESCGNNLKNFMEVDIKNGRTTYLFFNNKQKQVCYKKMCVEKVKIKIAHINYEKNKDIPLPKYMTKYSSGMDLYAAIEEDIEIKSQEIIKVKTGYSIALPKGFEAQIRARSGLAFKYGITLVNSIGTIDSDYRGEIIIALINLSKNSFVLKRGDRIAQMVIQKVYCADFELVSSLDETKRGKGGFGHTGI